MNLFNYFTPKTETFFMECNSTIRQALEKFDFHKFSVVPLIDSEGRYITTVSEGDILRFIKNTAHFDMNKAEKVRICDIELYRPYKACKSNMPIENIFKLALEQNFVPIVDDRGSYIGIIKRKTILDAMYKKNNIKKSAEE